VARGQVQMVQGIGTGPVSLAATDHCWCPCWYASSSSRVGLQRLSCKAAFWAKGAAAVVATPLVEGRSVPCGWPTVGLVAWFCYGWLSAVPDCLCVIQLLMLQWCCVPRLCLDLIGGGLSPWKGQPLLFGCTQSCAAPSSPALRLLLPHPSPWVWASL
jgi:hypothetical protein